MSLSEQRTRPRSCVGFYVFSVLSWTFPAEKDNKGLTGAVRVGIPGGSLLLLLGSITTSCCSWLRRQVCCLSTLLRRSASVGSKARRMSSSRWRIRSCALRRSAFSCNEESRGSGLFNIFSRSKRSRRRLSSSS
jgi:hypothetical protein